MTARLRGIPTRLHAQVGISFPAIFLAAINPGTEIALVDGLSREQRRSERVKLSVPVIVMAETREREQVQEETVTAVVNAHGGLFKLNMDLLIGQPILLVNPLTNRQESCRVVRVDDLPSGGFAVAFEFDTPAPQFWPLASPPRDWNLIRS